MRLLVDLFACQTDSRFRGIGRYTHSLVRELIKQCGSHQVIALANSLYPERFEDLRQEFTRFLPAGSFLPYRHEGLDISLGENDPYFAIASTLVQQAYNVLDGDSILYPSIFEGWGEKGVVPLPSNGFPDSLRSGIVYDFIPYIFQDRFLDLDPYYKQFYVRRLNILKEFHLLLAISESTRQDAIKFLNLPSNKVVNISAAASPIFKKTVFTEDEIKSLHLRFGITKPFVFYTGNVEYHKNMVRALRAFALLPKELREGHQLVLTHTGEETAFRKIVHSTGLEDNEIVITGHISDKDLVSLYNNCKTFIFPSLYEGFGLPILEAMSCGAPVIASNNSSIPEVMGRQDALFDGSDEESIATALYKVLTDNNFRKDLSDYGISRAKLFSWEKTARLAWLALEEAQKKNKEPHPVSTNKPATKRKLNIAYVSPLPPQKTGIANYSAELLPYLNRHFKIDLFTQSELKVNDPRISKDFRIYPWNELVNRRDEYDTVIYQIGNSQFHDFMFHLLREVPGIVVLHDFFLSHIKEYLYATPSTENSRRELLNEIGEVHGLFAMVNFLQKGLKEAIWDWPLNWDVLKFAQKLIVHSNYQISLIEAYYGKGWYPHPFVIKQLRHPERIASAAERKRKKQELGLDPDSFLFTSFGFLNSTKLNHTIIRAFSDLFSTDAQMSLVFIGELDNGIYGQSLIDLINKFGLSKQIKITGYVDDDTYLNYLIASDASIQLRIRSRGETSRAVLDCMAHGIPTIINSNGSLNDYHVNDVIKLSEHPVTDELTHSMRNIKQDDEFRKRIGQNAHSYIIKYHNPERIAERYMEVINYAACLNERVFFSPLVDALIKNNSSHNWLNSSALYAAQNLNLRNQPRILIDVTNISFYDLRTGIQRVVKNLIRGFYSNNEYSTHIELIRISDGQLYRASRFRRKNF